jgi:hypothetical protein
MVGNLDDEAGEVALTETLLLKLAAAGPQKPWLAVLDRLNCNLVFPQDVVKAGGHFLICSCTNTTFVPDATRPAHESRDAQGHRIVHEWSWLGEVEKEDPEYVRRITKHLPDSKAVSVVKDLLDGAKYPAEAVLLTYQDRWGIELDLRSIKITLHMDVLRCQTPELVRKEIWTHVLAHKLICTVIAQAATRDGVEPRSISFKATLQVLEAFRPLIPYHAYRGADDRAELYEQRIAAIAVHRVADRLDRFEPRMAKPRPKRYVRLTRPRWENESPRP